MVHEMNAWHEYYKIVQEDYHIEGDDTVIKIPYESIIDVTEKELIYKAGEGEIQSILLEECVKNFYSAFGVPTEEYATRQRKCIGGRYSEKPVAFYEIFTPHHHTRFCMTYKITPLKRFLSKIGWDAYSKEYSEFRALERRLNAIGYSTMDLT